MPNGPASKLEDKVMRMYADLYGNGKPGLLEDFRQHRGEFKSFRDIYNTRDEEKKIYEGRMESPARITVSDMLRLAFLRYLDGSACNDIQRERLIGLGLLQETCQDYRCDPKCHLSM